MSSTVDSEVVTRHNHLNAAGKKYLTCDVCGAQIELRTVLVMERCVTTTFFLFQDVNLSIELALWNLATWLADNHAAMDISLLNATQQ